MQNNKRLLHKSLCSSLFDIVFLTLAGSPSQALTRQLSQRESLWHSDKVSGYTGDPLCGKPFLKGKGLGKKMKLAGTAKGSHFGGAVTAGD